MSTPREEAQLLVDILIPSNERIRMEAVERLARTIEAAMRAGESNPSGDAAASDPEAAR